MGMVNWLTSQIFHHQQWSGYIEPIMQTFKPAWRALSYRAQVLSQSTLTENVVALELKVSERWPVHKAGQHVALTVELDGRLVTRTFTVASSPEKATEQRIVRLVIKQSEKGRLTPQLTTLPSGKWVNVSAPKGEFTLNTTAPHVAMFAAGSGITPFIAMLQSLPRDSAHKIHLLYYAKPGQHLLTDELNQLASTHKNLDIQFLCRQKDGDAATHLANYEDCELMVCGPNAFFESIKSASETLNIQVKSEHFSALPVIEEEEKALTVIYQQTRMALNNTKTLLPQLIEAGADVTYGCGIGICHQCQCIKKSGVVRNIKTGQLSDAGTALIQLCISQPVTPLELEA